MDHSETLQSETIKTIIKEPKITFNKAFSVYENENEEFDIYKDKDNAFEDYNQLFDIEFGFY